MTIIRTLLFALFSLYAFSFINTCSAQTYLSENFDGIWTGTPAAPSGWTQTRTQAILTVAERDWAQNTFTTVWSSPGGFVVPTTASPGSGASALWIEDNAFAGTSFAQSERTLQSPTFDLSLSTSPYVRFWYFNREGPNLTLNVRVVISTDGGGTWVTLSNVVNGFNTAVNTWNKINIPIPASLRSASNKIGIAIVNRFGGNNPFIDDVTVEEFTPTTITSSAAGDWNATATWAGGVIPTADNHVVIAHNVVVSNATPVAGIIARCQNLTINAGSTLSHSTGTTNLLQVFGNVSIDGTLNAFNGTSGRVVYVGGDFTINTGGTATLNTSTTTLGGIATFPAIPAAASGLIFTNAGPASFTNNGTLTANRINNILHLGSGTFTYNSPVGSVPFTFGLFRGLVNPNGNLTLGNAATTTSSATVQRINGAFTSAPLYSNTNVTSRSVAYLFSNMVEVTQTTITPGEEIQAVSGTRTITGTLFLNTHSNVQLGYPLTVGTGTTGAFTLIRGILITSSTNLLTIGAFVPGPTGTDASTTNPGPTTHGSYVAGPVRINFPSTGTTSRNFPLGLGTALNSLTTPTANLRKTLTIATSFSWAGQTITASLEPAPSGSVTGSLTAVFGATTYRLNLNGGPDLPSTATVSINANNYAFGNSDNIPGNQNNIFVAQSISGTSGWVARSASSGSGAAVANTNYNRITATAAPGPVAPLLSNGEYFAFATDAVLMTITSTDAVRNTNAVSAGATTNAQMLRIKVTTTGIAPIALTQFNLNTDSTSASALANITNAKVWYTGTSDIFAAANQFGSTVAAPSGSYSVTGSRTLVTGDNYFWVTYDLAPGTVLNDSFAAQVVSAIVNGSTQSISQASAGWRIASLPMTYVSSTGTQPFITKVSLGSTNNVVLGVQVVTSLTGSPINVTAMDIATTGTTALTDITNLRIWYTGTSNVFATTTQLGTTVTTPTATQTVTGSVSLTNGTNYFWVTYDIPSGAVVNNIVDAEVTGLVVDGTPVTPAVSAPAGTRQIKANYCNAAATNTADTDIGQVQLFDATNAVIFSNGAATPIQSNPLANGLYSNFTGLTPANVTRGLSYSIRMDQITSGGTFVAAGLIVYIDYNDDGDFTDPGEIAYTSGGIQTGPNATAPALPTRSFLQGSFTIPCTAALGNLLMRVILQEGNSATPSCGTFTYGEVEDYTINVLDNPVGFNFVAAEQQTGNVAPGTTNRGITRIPLLVNGCGTAVLSEVRMSTTGTTNNASIVNAKLYRTSSNSFNTFNLRSTVASPSGQFVFAIADTITTNDSNYYWLAYDVAAGATLGTVLDATLDSIQVLGVYQIPTVSNPAGNVYIDGRIYTWNQTAPADYTIASNWTPARTALSTSDKLVFNVGGNITVNNVVNETVSTINVSGSTNVQLNGAATALTVADSLKLTAGNVIPSLVTLTVGTSASQPGMITNDPGRVGGSLTRWIGTTPNSYKFPIANNTTERSAVINYTVVPGTSGTLTVGFNPANTLDNSGLPLAEGAIVVNKHTPNGYWEVTTGSGLTGGTFDITLNADSMIGITNVSSLVMLHRINSGNPWTLQGTHITTTGTAAAPVLSRTGVSVYGIWSFGSDSTMNPLPVTLTQFTATPSGKDVQVTWTTASELNNHGFDVERSSDGRTFEKIAFVKGAGNSNKVLNYSFTDEGIFNKATVWYYRLRQVDFDGKFEFSLTVRVNNVSENLQAISVSPNPYTDNFNISVFATLNGAVSIELVDIQGRVVTTSHAFVIEGANAITIKEGANLKAGIYFARIYMNGEIQVVKLVKD